MVADLAPAIAALRDARRLVVLTGAGVSTESGVPDFRGASGIWTTFDPRDFEYDRLLRDPAGFWALRKRLMDALDLASARPNAAHRAIAAASASPRFLGHVTQNIDGLFHEAGHAPNLVEAHGSARTVRCLSCARFFPFDPALLATIPPRCASCGGILKPGTILFGEPLHAPDLRRAEAWARQCDAMLVVGTSLVVHPIAALPEVALDAGAALVIVNEDPTTYDARADAVVRGKAGAVVPELVGGF